MVTMTELGSVSECDAASAHGLERTIERERRPSPNALVPFLMTGLALGLWVAGVTEVAAPLGAAVIRYEASWPPRTITPCAWSTQAAAAAVPRERAARPESSPRDRKAAARAGKPGPAVHDGGDDVDPQ